MWLNHNARSQDIAPRYRSASSVEMVQTGPVRTYVLQAPAAKLTVVNTNSLKLRAVSILAEAGSTFHVIFSGGAPPPDPRYQSASGLRHAEGRRSSRATNKRLSKKQRSKARKRRSKEATQRSKAKKQRSKAKRSNTKQNNFLKTTVFRPWRFWMCADAFPSKS